MSQGISVGRYLRFFYAFTVLKSLGTSCKISQRVGSHWYGRMIILIRTQLDRYIPTRSPNTCKPRCCHDWPVSSHTLNKVIHMWSLLCELFMLHGNYLPVVLTAGLPYPKPLRLKGICTAQQDILTPNLMPWYFYPSWIMCVKSYLHMTTPSALKLRRISRVSVINTWCTLKLREIVFALSDILRSCPLCVYLIALSSEAFHRSPLLVLLLTELLAILWSTNLRVYACFLSNLRLSALMGRTAMGKPRRLR